MQLKYVKRDLDPTARRFYERMEQGEFCVGKCSSCQTISFPPREFCPSCDGGSQDLVPHSGSGAVYAFTTQERGFRFTAPQVLGIVELDDGAGRAFGVIKANLDSLSIGMRVAIEPIKEEDFTLPAWRPEIT